MQALVVEEDPGSRLALAPLPAAAGGGVYQYGRALLAALPRTGRNGVTLLSEGDASATPPGFRTLVLPSPPRSLAYRAADRVVGHGKPRQLWRKMREERSRARNPDPDPEHVSWRPHLTSFLRDAGIDLVLHALPSTLAFEARVPYVMAVHDLQHRLQPEFPEVSAGREWETREYIFRNGIRFATRVLTDSEAGKEDVLTFYGSDGVDEDRVAVLPFAPSPYLRPVGDDEVSAMLSRYGLPRGYLFYPAQFWPHKNHMRIVEALRLLKGRRIDLPLVLTGSHADDLMRQTRRRLDRLIRTYGLEGSVHVLGHVPDADMSALYAAAGALLMPTFFGPTNIPVVEAWMFGCPVVTSDLRGIREHVGDAALLVDPRSIESIASGIERAMTDEDLRTRLADAGRARLGEFSEEAFAERLGGILDEAERVAAVEGFPRRGSG